MPIEVIAMSTSPNCKIFKDYTTLLLLLSKTSLIRDGNAIGNETLPVYISFQKLV